MRLTAAQREIPWLAYAATQVGYHEGPDNDNKFGTELGMNHEPWCDLFVACCCKNSGHPQPSMAPGFPTGAPAVFESIAFAKAHNLWVPSWQAGPGFQICYGWNGPNSVAAEMHTGFVVSAGPKGSTGHTIEGNRADQVEWQTFTVGSDVVLGTIDLPRLLLGRPKITVRPKKAKPTPQPRHPQHPANTGPTPLQAKRIAEARDLAKIAGRRRPVGKGRAALIAARAAINKALGRKAKK